MSASPDFCFSSCQSERRKVNFGLARKGRSKSAGIAILRFMRELLSRMIVRTGETWRSVMQADEFRIAGARHRPLPCGVAV